MTAARKRRDILAAKAAQPNSVPGDSTLPLLRWAGGKQHLLGEILLRLGVTSGTGRYVEPFLGAASVFLNVAPKRALIADLNYHLVDCYEQLRENPERVVSELQRLLATPVTEARYYEIREAYNHSKPSARQSARFIYLNKTCFNGIFRVNQRGEFNVPFGRKYTPAIPDHGQISAAARSFDRAELRREGYEDTLARVSRGDVVFLDPPYPPSSRTAYFAHYTTDRFSEFDQHRLAARVRELDEEGVQVMMTNADCTLIRNLYARFQVEELQVVRWVSCKKIKPVASELIIRNY